MKSKLVKYLFGVVIILFAVKALSQTVDLEVLAERGKGKVTQTEFAARVDKIPENIRRETLRDVGRLRTLINTLLLRSQLVADARESGFDQNTMVQERMQLAANAELAEAWIEHYVKMQPKANFEQLARESYELNKQDMKSSPKIDVSHILISTETRSVDEAKTLADTIREQIGKNPEIFDDLVLTHSDDLSSKSNHGKFYNVKEGDMVKPFEDVAFSLSKGEISAPVQTQYGFHIIRLDDFYPPVIMEFEDVKAQLIDRERARHEDRIKEDYIGGLTSIYVDMSQEALEEMVRRQFGEGYTDLTDGGVESE